MNGALPRDGPRFDHIHGTDFFGLFSPAHDLPLQVRPGGLLETQTLCSEQVFRLALAARFWLVLAAHWIFEIWKAFLALVVDSLPPVVLVFVHVVDDRRSLDARPTRVYFVRGARTACVIAVFLAITIPCKPVSTVGRGRCCASISTAC
jgi:hypothetical protein